MPEVQRAATEKTGTELYVAKAVPHTSEDHLKAEDRLSLKRVKVRIREEGDECTAYGPKGLTRFGRPMGIKPNLHWVIKSLPNGVMEIRPVKGWYDLATSLSASTSLAAPSASRTAPRAPAPRSVGATGDVATRELQQQALVRKESADRWDAMNKRRQQRVEETEVARRVDVVHKPEAAVDTQETGVAEEKRRKAAVLYPEESAADETGFQVHEEKRRKVLQKLQKAQDAGAEEQAVPDVASTLLELKRQQGEGAWDFSDEEEFSDDEEKDRGDADTQEVQVAQEDPHLPSGDEEDEEAQPEATLSGVGEELQVLLKVDPETVESPPNFEELGEVPSPEEEMSLPALVDRPSMDHWELQRRAVKCIKEKGEISPKELLRILGIPKHSFKVLKEVLTFDRDRGVVKLKAKGS